MLTQIRCPAKVHQRQVNVAELLVNLSNEIVHHRLFWHDLLQLFELSQCFGELSYREVHRSPMEFAQWIFRLQLDGLGECLNRLIWLIEIELHHANVNMNY